MFAPEIRYIPWFGQPCAEVSVGTTRPVWRSVKQDTRNPGSAFGGWQLKRFDENKLIGHGRHSRSKNGLASTRL